MCVAGAGVLSPDGTLYDPTLDRVQERGAEAYTVRFYVGPRTHHSRSKQFDPPIRVTCNAPQACSTLPTIPRHRLQLNKVRYLNRDHMMDLNRALLEQPVMHPPICNWRVWLLDEIAGRMHRLARAGTAFSVGVSCDACTTRGVSFT